MGHHVHMVYYSSGIAVYYNTVLYRFSLYSKSRIEDVVDSLVHLINEGISSISKHYISDESVFWDQFENPLNIPMFSNISLIESFMINMEEE